MTQNQTALENFLRWFLDLKEIPVQTKMAFAEHLIKVGGFDAVAAMYVEIIMEYLIQVSAEKAQLAKEQVNQLQSAIDAENNPKTSVRTKTVTFAIEKMNNLADNFKENLYSFEKEEAQKEESTENWNENTQIDALKASM